MTEQDYLYAQALTNIRIAEHVLRDTLPIGALTEDKRQEMCRLVCEVREQMHEDLMLTE